MSLFNDSYKTTVGLSFKINEIETSIKKAIIENNELEEITQEIQLEIPQQPQPIYVPNNDALKTNSYYKKLENNKKYINNNKEKVYEKQKEYRKTIPTEQQTRKRILRMLNNDSNYRNHIKPATIEKYSFKLDSKNRYY